MNEIKAILSDMGLGLGMKLDFFPPSQESDDEEEKAGSAEDTDTSTVREKSVAPAVETEDDDFTDEQ